jgi:hypothetical protein
MIIDDLEHLKCSSANNFDSTNILGGVTIRPPIINLASFTIANSFPTSIDLRFAADVKASQVSILKVFSGVFVQAISPL